MTQMKTTRRPVAGLLLPHQSIEITTDLPMQKNEAPLVLARHAADVRVADVRPHAFTVVNQTPRTLVYVAVIVPKGVINFAATPWKDIKKLLNSDMAVLTVQSFLANKLREIVTQFGGGAGRR